MNHPENTSSVETTDFLIEKDDINSILKKLLKKHKDKKKIKKI
jgi:hypothetical protein